MVFPFEFEKFAHSLDFSNYNKFVTGANFHIKDFRSVGHSIPEKGLTYEIEECLR